MNICLTVIMRDESEVITRLLNSVKPLIHSVCIIDTGSTDDSIALASQWLSDNNMPGVVLSKPWVDFATNRNQAIESAIKLCDADYMLFLDCDEILLCHKQEPLTLTDEAYAVPIRCGEAHYKRVALLSSKSSLRYQGVLHETLNVSPTTLKTLSNYLIVATADGARAKDPLKYQKDAQLLKRALLKQPKNLRYHFYLAQSYQCAGLLSEALTAYKARINLDDGRFPEELFIAKLRVANLKKELKFSTEEVTAAYMNAFTERPTRAEPLYYLSELWRKNKQYPLAYVFASAAKDIPYPTNDVLFIEKEVYDYKALDEYAVSAYWAGLPAVSLEASQKLLDSGLLPIQEHARVKENIRLIKEASHA